jgi:hypothetical protein
MTINVLPGYVMRTVFLSLAVAIVVFVGMLLLTTLHS